MKKMIAKAKVKSISLWHKTGNVLRDPAGESYVDTGVKILIVIRTGRWMRTLSAGMSALDYF